MFKSTARRHVESIDVAASARQFKEQVQQGLELLLATALQQGESMPDLTFFQELIGRLLETSGTNVLRVDGRLTSQQVSAAAVRSRRNELVQRLTTRMRDIRYMFDRSLEPAVAKAALRQRRLSKVQPTLLMQGARDLVATLRDPALAAKATDPALFASAAAFTSDLETDANELEQVLMQVPPQEKANQENLGAKVADLQAAAEASRRCSELLVGLYRGAGLDFHADRLRPRTRGKKRQAEPAKMTAVPEPVVALVRMS